MIHVVAIITAKPGQREAIRDSTIKRGNRSSNARKRGNAHPRISSPGTPSSPVRQCHT